jgi:hypothetical protein
MGDLFSTVMPVLRFPLAFIIVLALIGGLYYAARRFGSRALGGVGAARGRQPRLAVIDATSVDARRRLVLIRRDNVEHLIMIGGPSDIVIEPNIVRATPSASAREVAPARVADSLPRPIPLGDGGAWPPQPETTTRPQRAAPPAPPLHQDADNDWLAPSEPTPNILSDDALPHAPPEREPRIEPRVESRVDAIRETRIEPVRETRIEPVREPRIATEREQRVSLERELRIAPPTMARPAAEGAVRGQNSERQNSERLAGLAADLSRTFTDEQGPPAPPRRAEVRRAPPATPPAPTPPAPTPPVSESDEQNLADMAQQLESALQRPRPTAEPPAPVTARTVEVRVAAPVARAEAAPPPRPEPNPGANPGVKPVAKPVAKPTAQPAAKAGSDNLEQEMASLLGRRSGKS